MGDLLIGGLVAGGIFVVSAFILGSLLAFLFSKFQSSLSSDLIVLLSAATMPILAVIALFSLILTVIGVDDNGPQISGGIIIAIGLIILAAFGYVFGSVSARWTLGKIRSR